MDTLIIHPADRTTDFLCPLYEPIKNKTVIRSGCNKRDIRDLIKSHSRIIMLGHGCSQGLFSAGQFNTNGGLIIDEAMVSYLKDKECIFIWCHANNFVEQYKLKGITSSMFCSEYSECYWEKVENVRKGMVEESNDNFSTIMSRHINKSLNVIHKKLTLEYGLLGKTNPVAAYNNERLLLIK